MIPKISPKEIIGLIKKGANLEAEQKIMELKEKALELQEENLILKEENLNLKKQLEKKEQYEFTGIGYQKKGNSNSPIYCQICYEKENNHFTHRLTEDKEMGGFRCRVCKKSFGERREIKIYR
jgi:hypothetical protein